MSLSYAYLSLSSQMVAAGPSAPGGNLFNTHYSTNETEETAIVSIFLIRRHACRISGKLRMASVDVYYCRPGDRCPVDQRGQFDNPNRFHCYSRGGPDDWQRDCLYQLFRRGTDSESELFEREMMTDKKWQYLYFLEN